MALGIRQLNRFRHREVRPIPEHPPNRHIHRSTAGVPWHGRHDLGIAPTLDGCNSPIEVHRAVALCLPKPGSGNGDRITGLADVCGNARDGEGFHRELNTVADNSIHSDRDWAAGSICGHCEGYAVVTPARCGSLHGTIELNLTVPSVSVTLPTWPRAREPAKRKKLRETESRTRE